MTEAVPLSEIGKEAEAHRSSLWKDAWLRLSKNKLAMLGFIILILMLGVCVIGPFVSHYTYDAQDLELGAVPLNEQHWFGTDELGRDLLVRIFYGGRISFTVGFLATFVSLFIGVLWGAIAGFLGGKVDIIMMRIVDALYALPFIIFVILLMVMFGRSFILLFLAIGAVEWLTMARIVRGQVMSLRKQEFVDALLTMGISKRRIILRHLIPNTLGPIIIYATLTIPNVMLLEAFLSFLGLGIQPPMSSWGSLIASGTQVMEEYPWLVIFPGLALAVTLFSLNFLGDGLRDALDPRVSKD